MDIFHCSLFNSVIKTAYLCEREHKGGITMHVTSGLYIVFTIGFRKNGFHFSMQACTGHAQTYVGLSKSTSSRRTWASNRKTRHEQQLCLHTMTKHRFKHRSKQLAELHWQHTQLPAETSNHTFIRCIHIRWYISYVMELTTGKHATYTHSRYMARRSSSTMRHSA